MGKWGAAAVLLLAGFSALYPRTVSWAYVAAFIAFELWLTARLAAVNKGPVPVDEPPYRFTAEEAELVGRYRFYFTYPAIAREASSVLSAIGLSALGLAIWFTFTHALVQAVLTGINLFAVGRLTKQAAPLFWLHIRAAKGERAALRALELHDPLWAKIRAANTSADPAVTSS
jgi:hypothetical protein